MRIAAGCLLLAACATATAPTAHPTPTPAPVPASAPTKTRAPEAQAAPPACLPDAAPDIRYVAGDLRALHVCFSPTTCVAIDRHRTGPAAITAWTRPADEQPAHHDELHATADNVSDGLGEVCNDQHCWMFPAQFSPLVEGVGSAKPDDDELLVTIDHTHTKNRTLVALIRSPADVVSLADDGINHCATASWVDHRIFVVTDDCNGGHAQATVFDHRGHDARVLGGTLDVFGASGLAGRDALAILAPNAYALILVPPTVNVPMRVIDLVPLQAVAESSPRFAATTLPTGDWLIASDTGGVGIIDHTSQTLAKTWTVPRCPPPPAETPTGP